MVEMFNLLPPFKAFSGNNQHFLVNNIYCSLGYPIYSGIFWTLKNVLSVPTLDSLIYMKSQWN